MSEYVKLRVPCDKCGTKNEIEVTGVVSNLKVNVPCKSRTCRKTNYHYQVTLNKSTKGNVTVNKTAKKTSNGKTKFWKNIKSEFEAWLRFNLRLAVLIIIGILIYIAVKNRMDKNRYSYHHGDATAIIQKQEKLS